MNESVVKDRTSLNVNPRNFLNSFDTVISFESLRKS